MRLEFRADGYFGSSIRYGCSAGSNNGWIAEEGVMVNSPARAGWGQGFSYDGFGNLTGKTVTSGSAPPLTLLMDSATNRPMCMACSYDPNGNLLWWNTQPLTYDYENRLVMYGSPAGPGTAYGYDPDNRRVYTGQYTAGNGLESEEVSYWGVDGKLMGSFWMYATGPGGVEVAAMRFVASRRRVYYAGRLLVDQQGSQVG